MLDTLTPVRSDAAILDAEPETRFAELTNAIAVSGAVRRARRKFEAARDAASRTALLSPLMFVAACASGGSGDGGGARGQARSRRRPAIPRRTPRRAARLPSIRRLACWPMCRFRPA
ncbi:hypothetical protein [Hankyongella ginsenosidimutans]|uniref:hypothetical protein n=1 Tax=Hankyongella ginsenosidimutans TaxID=1763828 RepID=UPI001CA31576|nr:hypothetical protein [Hankyongella ginsenosidimutans]